MLILSLSCNNIFMFSDFYLDFTYSRKINNSMAENDKLFPNSKINVRKSMILMGGNASGKTTFGKLLCAINNFVLGREVAEKNLNLFEAIYDKSKDANFTIEFVIDRIAFKVECVFNVSGIIREKITEHSILASYNIKKLRDVLENEEKNVKIYTNDNLGIQDNKQNEKNIKPFFSKILKNPANEELYNKLSNNIGFHYLFSNFAEQSNETTINIPIDLLNSILPEIDNSIKKIVRMVPDDKTLKNNTYVIVFNNGDQLTIPDGDLKNANKSRLSHGTYEALTFLNILEEIKARKKDIIFVDEKLPHLHSELEAYLIKKAFLILRDSQMFFTCDNSELLDLNIPYNAFMLFKRTDEFNQAFFINNKFNKNDRSLKTYYENDYFGVLPDYSNLDAYFEGENDE